MYRGENTTVFATNDVWQPGYKWGRWSQSEIDIRIIGGRYLTDHCPWWGALAWRENPFNW